MTPGAVMVFLVFMALFLPLGLLVLRKSDRWTQGFREALEGAGMRRGLISGIAVGWTIFGALAVVAILVVSIG